MNMWVVAYPERWPCLWCTASMRWHMDLYKC